MTAFDILIIVSLAALFIFILSVKWALESLICRETGRAMDRCYGFDKYVRWNRQTTHERIGKTEKQIKNCEKENPYHPDTQVTVFTESTEADAWFAANCDKCANLPDCNLFKTMVSTANPIYFRIPLSVGQAIGMKYNALYRQGRLGNRCEGFRDINDDGELEI